MSIAVRESTRQGLKPFESRYEFETYTIGSTFLEFPAPEESSIQEGQVGPHRTYFGDT